METAIASLIENSLRTVSNSTNKPNTTFNPNITLTENVLISLKCQAAKAALFFGCPVAFRRKRSTEVCGYGYVRYVGPVQGMLYPIGVIIECLAAKDFNGLGRGGVVWGVSYYTDRNGSQTICCPVECVSRVALGTLRKLPPDCLEHILHFAEKKLAPKKQQVLAPLLAEMSFSFHHLNNGFAIRTTTPFQPPRDPADEEENAKANDLPIFGKMSVTYGRQSHPDVYPVALMAPEYPEGLVMVPVGSPAALVPYINTVPKDLKCGYVKKTNANSSHTTGLTVHTPIGATVEMKYVLFPKVPTAAAENEAITRVSELQELIATRQVDKVKGLMASSPESAEFLRSRDAYNNTPVHVAAQTGNVDIWKALNIPFSALTLRNQKGQTPIHVAIHWGKKTLVQHVFQNLSSEEAAKLLVLADRENVSVESGLEALGLAHIALKYRTRKISTRTSAMFTTEVHDVVLMNDVESFEKCVDVLKDQAARLKGPGGVTPIHLAARNGNVAILRLAIESLTAEALYLPVDNSKRTCLHHAASARNLDKSQETFKLLLGDVMRHEAVNSITTAVDSAGDTILHILCSRPKYSLDIVKQVIEKTSLTIINSSGHTPLSIALHHDHPIVEDLTKHSASLCFSHQLLRNAIKRNRWDIVKQCYDPPHYNSTESEEFWKTGLPHDFIKTTQPQTVVSLVENLIWHPCEGSNSSLLFWLLAYGAANPTALQSQWAKLFEPFVGNENENFRVALWSAATFFRVTAVASLFYSGLFPENVMSDTQYYVVTATIEDLHESANGSNKPDDPRTYFPPELTIDISLSYQRPPSKFNWWMLCAERLAGGLTINNWRAPQNVGRLANAKLWEVIMKLFSLVAKPWDTSCVDVLYVVVRNASDDDAIPALKYVLEQVCACFDDSKSELATHLLKAMMFSHSLATACIVLSYIPDEKYEDLQIPRPRQNSKTSVALTLLHHSLKHLPFSFTLTDLAIQICYRSSVSSKVEVECLTTMLKYQQKEKQNIHCTTDLLSTLIACVRSESLLKLLEQFESHFGKQAVVAALNGPVVKNTTTNLQLSPIQSLLAAERFDPAVTRWILERLTKEGYAQVGSLPGYGQISIREFSTLWLATVTPNTPEDVFQAITKNVPSGSMDILVLENEGQEDPAEIAFCSYFQRSAIGMCGRDFRSRVGLKGYYSTLKLSQARCVQALKTTPTTSFQNADDAEQWKGIATQSLRRQWFDFGLHLLQNNIGVDVDGVGVSLGHVTKELSPLLAPQITPGNKCQFMNTTSMLEGLKTLWPNLNADTKSVYRRCAYQAGGTTNVVSIVGTATGEEDAVAAAKGGLTLEAEKYPTQDVFMAALRKGFDETAASVLMKATSWSLSGEDLEKAIQYACGTCCMKSLEQLLPRVENNNKKLYAQIALDFMAFNRGGYAGKAILPVLVSSPTFSEDILESFTDWAEFLPPENKQSFLMELMRADSSVVKKLSSSAGLTPKVLADILGEQGPEVPLLEQLQTMTLKNNDVDVTAFLQKMRADPSSVKEVPTDEFLIALHSHCPQAFALVISDVAFRPWLTYMQQSTKPEFQESGLPGVVTDPAVAKEREEELREYLHATIIPYKKSCGMTISVPDSEALTVQQLQKIRDCNVIADLVLNVQRQVSSTLGRFDGLKNAYSFLSKEYKTIERAIDRKIPQDIARAQRNAKSCSKDLTELEERLEQIKAGTYHRPTRHAPRMRRGPMDNAHTEADVIRRIKVKTEQVSNYMLEVDNLEKKLVEKKALLEMAKTRMENLNPHISNISKIEFVFSSGASRIVEQPVKLSPLPKKSTSGYGKLPRRSAEVAITVNLDAVTSDEVEAFNFPLLSRELKRSYVNDSVLSSGSGQPKKMPWVINILGEAMKSDDPIVIDKLYDLVQGINEEYHDQEINKTLRGVEGYSIGLPSIRNGIFNQLQERSGFRYYSDSKVQHVLRNDQTFEVSIPKFVLDVTISPGGEHSAVFSKLPSGMMSVAIKLSTTSSAPLPNWTSIGAQIADTLIPDWSSTLEAKIKKVEERARYGYYKPRGKKVLDEFVGVGEEVKLIPFTESQKIEEPTQTSWTTGNTGDILHFHLGGLGCEVGRHLWNKMYEAQQRDGACPSIYSESSNGTLQPRTLWFSDESMYRKGDRVPLHKMHQVYSSYLDDNKWSSRDSDIVENAVRSEFERSGRVNTVVNVLNASGANAGFILGKILKNYNITGNTNVFTVLTCPSRMTHADAVMAGRTYLESINTTGNNLTVLMDSRALMSLSDDVLKNYGDDWRNPIAAVTSWATFHGRAPSAVAASPRTLWTNTIMYPRICTFCPIFSVIRKQTATTFDSEGFVRHAFDWRSGQGNSFMGNITATPYGRGIVTSLYSATGPDTLANHLNYSQAFSEHAAKYCDYSCISMGSRCRVHVNSSPHSMYVNGVDASNDGIALFAGVPTSKNLAHWANLIHLPNPFRENPFIRHFCNYEDGERQELLEDLMSLKKDYEEVCENSVDVGDGECEEEEE